MVGSARDEVAIDDRGFVDVDSAADFEFETAFGDGGHSPSADAVGVGRDFDSVADAGDGLVIFEKVAGNSDEIFVVSNVFGGSSARKEDAEELGGIDVGECQIAIEGIAFPFLGDGPARFSFVQNGLVGAFFGGDDDGAKLGFLEPVERIHRVEEFRGVADNDQDLVHSVRSFIFPQKVQIDMGMNLSTIVAMIVGRFNPWEANGSSSVFGYFVGMDRCGNGQLGNNSGNWP